MRFAGVFAGPARIRKNEADASEFTLDVYTQVWRRAAGYDPERGSVTAWLLTIVRSRSIDKVRSAGKAGDAPTDAADPEEHNGYGPTAAPGMGCPEYTETESSDVRWSLLAPSRLADGPNRAKGGTRVLVRSNKRTWQPVRQLFVDETTGYVTSLVNIATCSTAIWSSTTTCSKPGITK